MIKEFKGKYDWLSNFAPCLIEAGIYIFPSVEHAYMSEKSSNDSWKIFCLETESAGKVKIKSKGLALQADWHKKKVEIMKGFLVQKFSQEPYRTKLINTGSKWISEGNSRGDSFWGVNLKTNQGQNKLGLLIMDIRNNLTSRGWLQYDLENRER